MVRPGVKVAAGYVCSYMLAQLLREREIIECDPMDVYYFSALGRDVLMLIPPSWEEYMEDSLVRMATSIKRKVERLCGVEQQLPR